MPKLKRASSSLLSSRAKKCKKKQKEDPVQRQQQRERDRLRYQAHSSRRAQPRSEKTQEATDISRRQRDTAARQQVCQQNPQRRLLEIWLLIDGFVSKILLEGLKSKKGMRLPIDEFVLIIPTEGLKNKLEILQPIKFQGKIPI